MANFFHGDGIRECYQTSDDGNEKLFKRKKMWGQRVKYILDLFSFFICYKCVDELVTNSFMVPMSDITTAVMNGLPSRQLHEQEDHQLMGNGFSHVSHVCSNVIGALDNPYAEDMLNWIALHDFESEEAKSLIRNAKKCGWSSTGEIEEYGSDDEENSNANTVAVKKHDHHDDIETGVDDIGSKYPPFIKPRQIISAQDAKYLEATISREAYWELLSEPSPKFFDSSREYILLTLLSVVCIGLLYHFRIPFQLI